MAQGNGVFAERRKRAEQAKIDRQLAIELIDDQGLSIQEAAAEMKKPAQAVGSLYCFAKLRERR